jgi:hypothetical protein
MCGGEQVNSRNLWVAVVSMLGALTVATAVWAVWPAPVAPPPMPSAIAIEPPAELLPERPTQSPRQSAAIIRSALDQLGRLVEAAERGPRSPDRESPEHSQCMRRFVPAVKARDALLQKLRTADPETPGFYEAENTFAFSVQCINCSDDPPEFCPLLLQAMREARAKLKTVR